MRSTSGPDSLRRCVRRRRASSGSARRIAVPAARAGIHRGDQLASGREVGLLRRARNRDAAGLQRLAQHLEHVPVEFREFVEEQHAEVRERDLARLRRVAAADQRGARRVMRRAERPPAPLRGREAEAARGEERRRRQRLVVGQRRQEAGSRAASIDLPAPAARPSACDGRPRRLPARGGRAGRPRRRDRGGRRRQAVEARCRDRVEPPVGRAARAGPARRTR